MIVLRRNRRKRFLVDLFKTTSIWALAIILVYYLFILKNGNEFNLIYILIIATLTSIIFVFFINIFLNSFNVNLRNINMMESYMMLSTGINLLGAVKSKKVYYEDICFLLDQTKNGFFLNIKDSTNKIIYGIDKIDITEDDFILLTSKIKKCK